MNSGANQRPVVFFGTEDFSLASLKALAEAGYNLAAVVTKPDSRRGRHKTLVPPAVKVYASSRDIPVWQPKNLTEIRDNIKALDSPIGVLVSYGKIVPESIINLFTPGIINVHPSLLPKYRGPSPIESAIKNLDSNTGITIIKLTKKMDAGPIYSQVKHRLNFTETQPELYETLANKGAELLLKVLPKIMLDLLSPIDQDESKASYCSLLTKEQSELSPWKHSALELEAQIRAHLTYPKSRISINGFDLIVTKAHVSSQFDSQLDIICTSQELLSIDEVITKKGKKMSRQEFWNGYRQYFETDWEHGDTSPDGDDSKTTD